MTFARFAAAVLLFAAISIHAEDRPTNPDKVKDALERGKSVRARSGVAPNALQQSVLILSLGVFRCGHARVTIEDAGGEGGAVYRLREDFKLATGRKGHEELSRYTATYLLAADGGLLSAQASSHSEVKSPINSRNQTMKAILTVKDDALNWEITEDGGPEPRKGKMALVGTRPIPKNALLLVSAFAASEKNFKPAKAKPICVPTIELNGSGEAGQLGIDLGSVWITFAEAEKDAPKGTGMLMRLRYPVTEMTAKGLDVEILSPQVWEDVETWTLDASGRRIEQHGSGDMNVEPADPATFDPEAPIDLAKIAEIMEGRIEQQKAKARNEKL